MTEHNRKNHQSLRHQVGRFAAIDSALSRWVRRFELVKVDHDFDIRLTRRGGVSITSAALSINMEAFVVNDGFAVWSDGAPAGLFSEPEDAEKFMIAPVGEALRTARGLAPRIPEWTQRASGTKGIETVQAGGKVRMTFRDPDRLLHECAPDEGWSTWAEVEPQFSWFAWPMSLLLWTFDVEMTEGLGLPAFAAPGRFYPGNRLTG